MLGNPFIEELIELTTALVAVPSITGTTGEVDVADLIIQRLKALPYFRNNPHHLWTQSVPGDELGRKNIFALVRSTKATAKTILLHSHLDTVGIQDYGSLQEFAFDPGKLKLAFANHAGDESVLKCAHSDDWLFGRGALDMKSGLAVQMKLVEYWTKKLHELPGNILFMANPSEESHHGGMLAALSELLRLRDEEGFQYLCAINSDYVTALYPDDAARYIYTGTTGKLLLNVYIRGAETHVGQAFSGFDPLLVLTEVLRVLNYNTEFVEKVGHEATQPPVALYVRDRKETYNVQTAGVAAAYWNWFTLKKSPLEVLAEVKEHVKHAVMSAKELRSQAAARQIQLLGFGAATRAKAVEEFAVDMPVYTFAEWLEHLDETARQRVNEVLKADFSELTHKFDQREVVQVMIEHALKAAEYSGPILLLYLTPPFLPHNYIEGTTCAEQSILDAVRSAAAELSLPENEQFVIQRYFPFLSDSSFLRLMMHEVDLQGFIQNCPGWGNLFELPLEQVKALNIPTLNLGVYGFDAHKPTERLDIAYSFGILPQLIKASMTRIFAAFL